jgi:hypothetical protein
MLQTLLINSQNKLWGNLDNALDIFKLFSYTESLKISKAVIKVPTQFVVVTVYEKSLKISKAVIKVPTQFVVTVYEKSLKVCEP